MQKAHRSWWAFLHRRCLAGEGGWRRCDPNGHYYQEQDELTPDPSPVNVATLDG